jgi:hypothetical protein
MEVNEESYILYLFFRRNTKKKKESSGIEFVVDPLAMDQSTEELVLAEAPITSSPPVTIVESLDGSLTSVTTSAASSLTISTAAASITATTTVTNGTDPLSVTEIAGKSVDDDFEKPVLIKESEDPASPNKSLSESCVKGTPTSKKPKRDRKPKVKAIFPGKKNSK